MSSGVINPLYEMAAELNLVMPHLSGPRRYLRLAKELIAASITQEQVREWYGDGGLWYTNDWRGQRGQGPSEAGIRETVIRFRDGVGMQVAGRNLMSEFFAAVETRQAGD